MTPEPQGVDARFERIKSTIKRLAPFCPGAPFVLNTGAAVNGNMAEVMDVCVKLIGELAHYAEGHGVRLAIEPLNPTLMNTETAIWTVKQALDLLDRIDRETVGLCLDAWNDFQEPDLAAQILRAGARISAQHVSDWRVPLFERPPIASTRQHTHRVLLKRRLRCGVQRGLHVGHFLQ